MDNDSIEILWWSYPLNPEHNVNKCVYKKHQKGGYTLVLFFTVETSFFLIYVVYVRWLYVTLKMVLWLEGAGAPEQIRLHHVPEIVCRFSGEDGVN